MSRTPSTPPHPRGGQQCRIALAAAFFSCAATSAPAQTLTVAPELWDRPRSAATVTAVPAIRDAATRMVARADARLVIRHARSPEAGLQAEELRSWLVAHAIEAQRIELRGDLAPKQAIVLEVTP
jgi:hypothetical protein